jgi:hypothetical protein
MRALESISHLLMKTYRNVIVGLVAIAVLFALAASILQARERRYPPPVAASEDTMFITSGDALRRMSIGYSPLAADLYWIRTIQYYGSTRLRLSSDARSSGTSNTSGPIYPLLYPMLDVTTTLDPRFNIAFRFGAIFSGRTLSGWSRPSRSRHRAARERATRQARPMGIHAGHWLRPLLVASRLPGCG